MQLFIRSMLMAMLSLSLLSCKKNLSPEEIPAHIGKGRTYYTQLVIRYEKDTYLTTNYRRGASIPINTPVKLLDINSKEISVELASNRQTLLVKNVEKHTGDDIY